MCVRAERTVERGKRQGVWGRNSDTHSCLVFVYSCAMSEMLQFGRDRAVAEVAVTWSRLNQIRLTWQRCWGAVIER